jgi:adenylate cyclase
MTTRVAGALVFADLAGFTAFTSVRGDEAAIALIERFTEIVGEHLPAGGRIVKELGDGLFLFIDNVLEAVCATLAITARGVVESDRDEPLWVRAGMHAGSALTRGDDLIGHDVNVASRITDLAAPGEVLVSASVVEACDSPSVCFEPLGPAFLRGIDDPIRLSRARTSSPLP